MAQALPSTGAPRRAKLGGSNGRVQVWQVPASPRAGTQTPGFSLASVMAHNPRTMRCVFREVDASRPDHTGGQAGLVLGHAGAPPSAHSPAPGPRPGQLHGHRCGHSE